MDLSQFIYTTLNSVREGLKQANADQSNSFVMHSTKNKIDFDIAVEVSEEKQSGKGGGVRIKVIEGKIDSKKSSKESSVSRIKFSVNVATQIR